MPVTNHEEAVMSGLKSYKVKEVASIAGVSVRTLHYYDEIGLLCPGSRTPAGYRLYNENDLLRLQQILIGRSLGLALEDIRSSLDDDGFDYAKSLQEQRGLLIERLGQTHKMIAAIDTTLTNMDQAGGKIDMRNIFDGFDPADHEDEAAERWDHTDAYKQSARRTKNHTEADLVVIKSELDAIWTTAAEAMRRGEATDSCIAQDIVEQHRKHICRWFYDLSPEMHLGLAAMWKADDRFRSNIDKHGVGLTNWFARAIHATSEAI